MIIYRSENIERWNEVMDSYVAGTRFYCKTKTGEDDLGFEFERKVADILKDVNVCPAEMFDDIWQMQEAYTKMTDVYNTLMNKYDLSRIEAQHILLYFHLNLPKNEKGNPIQMQTWKKYRNREQIWREYINDVNNNPDKIRVCSDSYILKDMMKKGKINFGGLIDLMNRPDFANIIDHCAPIKKND